MENIYFDRQRIKFLHAANRRRGGNEGSSLSLSLARLSADLLIQVLLILHMRT